MFPRIDLLSVLGGPPSDLREMPAAQRGNAHRRSVYWAVLPEGHPALFFAVEDIRWSPAVRESPAGIATRALVPGWLRRSRLKTAPSSSSWLSRYNHGASTTKRPNWAPEGLKPLPKRA